MDTEATENIRQSKDIPYRCGDCEPCVDDSGYIFISYAHVDRPMVQRIINLLDRRGFRIWYDRGISGGTPWRDVLKDRMNHSQSCLAFLSGGVEQRHVIMDELTWAIERAKSDENYQLVFVLLDKVSPSLFPGKIQDYLKECQSINLEKMGGLTERLANALLSICWPHAIVDENYRRAMGYAPWNPQHVDEGEVTKGIAEQEGELSYVYPRARLVPAEAASCGRTFRFYKISPDSVDPDTVHPMCIDNQWVPEDMYTRRDFQTDGLRCPSVSADIQSRQRREIYQALLHNWQMVVNRAYLMNSQVFSAWYMQEGTEDYEAFAALVSNGSILAYLMEEKDPAEHPPFDTSKQQLAMWQKFCERYSVSCLRFDWDNEESNAYETKRLLGYSFQNFCLTTANDAYRQEELAAAFNIRDRDAFAAQWQKIQEDVQAFADEQSAKPLAERRPYSRSRFYQTFICDLSDGRQVDDGVLDMKKGPFVRELKQIADFEYGMNFAAAMNIQPLVPGDSRLKNFAFSERIMEHAGREIGTDELTFAVTEFVPRFLRKQVLYAENLSLSLSRIHQIRQTDGWRSYMNSITAGRRRAGLDQLDLLDTVPVWEKYQTLMETVQTMFPNESWQRRQGSLSMIYRFGEQTLISVYRHGAASIEIDDRGVKDRERMQKKSVLTVDYVCGDVLAGEMKNGLLAEIRLFQGLTRDRGADACEKLLGKLKSIHYRGDVYES